MKSRAITMAMLTAQHPPTRRGRGQRAARAMTPEGATLKAIRQACALHGVPCYRLGAGGFQVGERYVPIGSKGLCDVLLFTTFGPAFVEVKSPRGKLTPEQQKFREQCKACGAIHVVARSVDDILPWLRGGRKE